MATRFALALAALLLVLPAAAQVKGQLGSQNVKSTGSTTFRSLSDRFADRMNAKDWGLVANKAADQSALALTFIRAAKTARKCAFFPAGIWYIGHVNLSTDENVCIEGEMPMDSNASTGLQGTVFRSWSGGDIFTFGNGTTAVRNIRLRNFGVLGCTGCSNQDGITFKGVFWANVENVTLTDCDGNNFVVEGGTIGSSYLWFQGFSSRSSGNGAALKIDAGAAYVTAVGLNNFELAGANDTDATALHLIEVYAISMTNGWIQVSDSKKGHVKIQAYDAGTNDFTTIGIPAIWAANVTIDSEDATDVLIEVTNINAANNSDTTRLINGYLNVDGKIEYADATSYTMSGGFRSYKHRLSSAKTIGLFYLGRGETAVDNEAETNVSIERQGADGSAAVAIVNNAAWKLGRGLAFTPATVTYSASMTPDCTAGGVQVISANNGTAFTINAATGCVSGQLLTVTIRNVRGGGAALGAATWAAGYHLAAAWTQPADTFQRTITFRYDGTSFLEINRTTGDVAN